MEGFFAALVWAAAWQVHVINYISWARGYGGSEKSVSNRNTSAPVCRIEMSGRWKKPLQQELPVPVQTRKMVGSHCFFGLAPHLGTGFYVLVSEPG